MNENITKYKVIKSIGIGNHCVQGICAYVLNKNRKITHLNFWNEDNEFLYDKNSKRDYVIKKTIITKRDSMNDVKGLFQKNKVERKWYFVFGDQDEK